MPKRKPDEIVVDVLTPQRMLDLGQRCITVSAGLRTIHDGLASLMMACATVLMFGASEKPHG